MDKDKFYIGEDGLEHCAVCQESVEKYLREHVQEIFHMKTHPRQCACVRAQMEKEKQERKEREHLQEVEKNTTICFPERAMRECRPPPEKNFHAVSLSSTEKKECIGKRVKMKLFFYNCCKSIYGFTHISVTTCDVDVFSNSDIA